MPSSNQPLIPVKKSDGTTVRMTLSEFQAYQKNARATQHAHVGTLKQHVSTSARQQVSTPSIGSDPDQLVRYVLENTTVKIPKEFADRLRSLILSRVKDVRTDDQFLAQAMTPTHRGGVGLSPDDANALLRLVQSVLPSPERKLPKPKVFAVPTETAPTPIGTESLSARKEENKTAPLLVGEGEVAPLPVIPQYLQTSPATRMMTRKRDEHRVMVHDVTMPPPLKQSVGPLDELARFSLADFRRLGATPDAAVSRIKEKFETLKEESYLLFMQARDAWRQCPLYREYIRILTDALRQGVKVSDLLATASKERVSMEVFRGIVEINKMIGN